MPGIEQTTLITLVAKELDLETSSGYFTLKELEERINALIEGDFQRLVAILYRMDVDEEKLKARLLDHPDQDAAHTIAALMMERQMQKIKNREAFKTKPPEPGEETW